MFYNLDNQSDEDQDAFPGEVTSNEDPFDLYEPAMTTSIDINGGTNTVAPMEITDELLNTFIREQKM